MYFSKPNITGIMYINNLLKLFFYLLKTVFVICKQVTILILH
jgi:hypothetical protein